MKTFFKLVLLIILVGIGLVVFLGDGLKPEEKILPAISLIGLVIMGKLGVFKGKKNS